MSKIYIIDIGETVERLTNPQPAIVVACMTDRELANTFAQTYTYVKHGNAIYGFWGVHIGTISELLEKFVPDVQARVSEALLAFTAKN